MTGYFMMNGVLLAFKKNLITRVNLYQEKQRKTILPLQRHQQKKMLD